MILTVDRGTTDEPRVPSPPSAPVAFGGAVPVAYDRYLGPLLFEPTARDLARRVAPRVAHDARVLEVACGTGIATAELHRALPRSEIFATDLNEAMVHVARERRGHLDGVRFDVADALELPHPDASFDMVVCQFGIMFFADKLRGLEEMTRVLRPGGTLAFNVWDSLAGNPVAAIAHETIGSFFAADPPRFLEVPFGFADLDHIRSLMREAGLAEAEVHAVRPIVEQADGHGPARGLVTGTPGIVEIRSRAGAPAEVIVEAVAEALEASFGPAPLAIPLSAFTFLATKP